MATRWMLIHLYLVCCVCYSVQYISFVNITVDGQFYYLSSSITSETDAAAYCMYHLMAELAFFDTNLEYVSVTNYLSSYFSNLKIAATDVWLQLNATVNSRGTLYDHWWKQEPVDADLWAYQEPDTVCLRPSWGPCCVRMSWSEVNIVHLRDKPCLDHIDFLCKDLNECQNYSHNCSDFQVCINKPFGFDCICEPGFQFDENRSQCLDVDECGSNPCNQKCSNTPGSYNCNCYSGYELGQDKHTCVDINECPSANCTHTCMNLNGSYICECNPGFHLAFDNRSCEDIDECKTHQHDCEQKCVNTEATFMCTCEAGYSLMLDNKSCEVDDNCLDLSPPCVYQCVNAVGNYSCQCPEGFQSVGVQCLDVDECATQTHNCSQICQNREGSYECSCHTGYRLSTEDKRTCVDINECMEGLHNCSHLCMNVNGSHFCACHKGFILDPSDNTSCVDINECDNNSNHCQHYCNNTAGSFSCSCPPKQVLQQDRLSCVKVYNQHQCPCSCHSVHLLNNFQWELFQQDTEQMQRNIQVETGTLSATIRKKTSVVNQEPSAKVIGGSGLTIMAVFLGSIVVFDAVNLVLYLFFKYEKPQIGQQGRRLRRVKF